MKRIILMITFLGTFLVCDLATAQTRTPRINQRQHMQQQRIKQGVRTGELTRSEAHQLQRRERKIQHDKRMAKSDGIVTANERRHIAREENRTSRAIYRKKHNNIYR